MSVGLGLDFGVSVYPLDGEQREALIRIADERLYEMERVLRSQAPPHQGRRRPLPLRFPRSPPEPPSPGHPASGGLAAPVETHPPTPVRQALGNDFFHGLAKPIFSGPERRKWERVSLAGTRAHAELTDHGTGIVKVLDLGYGGVALEFGVGEDFGAMFFAVLRVPILPPVRVSLKRLYQISREDGQMR